MYFIPFHSRLYSWAAHNKPRNRYLFLCAVLLFFLGFSYFFHSYVSVMTSQLQSSIVQKNKQLIAQKKTAHEVAQLKSSLQTMKTSFAQHAKHASDFQSQLSYILNAVQKSGLKLTGYNADKPKDKQWYIKSKPQFQLEGSSEHVVQFFNDLKASQKMIQCTQFGIADLDGRQRVACAFTLKKVATA